MSRYSKGAIILHWLMAVMIIGNLAGGFLHDFVPKEGGQRALVMGMHKGFGLIVIALTFARIGWRIANPPPAFPHYFTGGERLLAKAAHGAFYLLMLAIPFTGWAMADRNARPLTVFGSIDVPKLGLSQPIADAAHELHETLGWVMLALLALHIIGLLKHLVLDRDNLLVRMGLGSSRA